MASRKDWNDEDERPTNRGGKRISRIDDDSRSDNDHTLGVLMVDVLNHRHRIETLEERLVHLETTTKKFSLAPPSGSDRAPSGRQRLFAIIRKTVTTTVVIIAAVISALRELGYLGLH